MTVYSFEHIAFYDILWFFDMEDEKFFEFFFMTSVHFTKDFSLKCTLVSIISGVKIADSFSSNPYLKVMEPSVSINSGDNMANKGVISTKN